LAGIFTTLTANIYPIYRDVLNLAVFLKKTLPTGHKGNDLPLICTKRLGVVGRYKFLIRFKKSNLSNDPSNLQYFEQDQ
jgi:hypothetical protein